MMEASWSYFFFCVGSASTLDGHHGNIKGRDLEDEGEDGSVRGTAETQPPTRVMTLRLVFLI